jgi:hypothetical protein
VVAAWKDLEGSLCCTVDRKPIAESNLQVLWKLSQSGKTFEWNSKLTQGEVYPMKIDPAPDPNAFPRIYYGIWYRQ